MKKEDLVLRTEDYIKNIPTVKDMIKDLDRKIEKYNEKIDIFNREIEEILRQRRVLEIKVEKLKNSMNILSEDEQKILCYRFFEHMSYSAIGSKLRYSSSYCDTKKVNELLFKVGSGVFIADILLEGLK